MPKKDEKRPKLKRKEKAQTEFEAYHRTENERLADYVFISERLLRQFAHSKILTELNAERPYELSQIQFKKDVKVIYSRWFDEIAKTATDARAREIAKLDLIEREAWEAWDNSIGVKVSKTSSVMVGVPDANDANSKAFKSKIISKTETESCGDTAYMKVIISSIEMRCKLLGLLRKEIRVWFEDAPEVEAQKEVFHTAVVVESNGTEAEVINFPFVDENEIKPSDCEHSDSA